MFAFPANALGGFLSLAPDPGTVHALLIGFLLALFGCTYAWLARRPVIDRPLLGFFAIGKSGAFLLALALWLVGVGSGALVALASGDLALASLWFWWLFATRTETHS